MKLKFLGALVAVGVFGSGSQAYAAGCGNVTIASMNWQSAELEGAVDKVILQEGYGCSVNTVVGDTVPTITAMVDKGKPDITVNLRQLACALTTTPEKNCGAVRSRADERALIDAPVAVSRG